MGNLFLGSSIFGCEAYRIYSDVATWISPGQVNTVQVFDPTGNDFHFEKRKHMGTWVNAGIFIQVWKALQQETTSTLKNENIWELGSMQVFSSKCGRQSRR